MCEFKVRVSIWLLLSRFIQQSTRDEQQNPPDSTRKGGEKEPAGEQLSKKENWV